MFEYKFAKEPIKRTFTSKKSTDNTVDNIENIIQEHAKEGWRFVQIFTPVGEGLLAGQYYEIIFERNIE